MGFATGLAVATVLGFALVVLLVYAFPYSSDLAVDSEPFREGLLGRLYASAGG